MAEVINRIDGVVIGALIGFERGKPLVVYAGNPKDHAITARSTTELTYAMIGCDLALLFEGGDPARPLIVGRIVDPVRGDALPSVIRDGELVRVTAQEQLELRCGKASIVMKKDGHITIRGSYLVSHASAANRIRGGSVNLN